MINFWKDKFVWSYKLTIKIFSAQTGTIITHNNTIRIDHRNNFEHQTISEIFALLGILAKVIDKAFHHKGAVALSGMYSPRCNDELFNNKLILGSLS